MSEADQLVTGWRSIFSSSVVYRIAQRGIGATRLRTWLVRERLGVVAGQRVIDLGSGTSDIVDHLPEVEYIGVEPSGEYVESARQRFGPRVTIVQAGIDEFDPAIWENSADFVISIGVLHHLDDESARVLLATAKRLLRPAGRLVTIDPCLDSGQRRLARALIVRDRGQHVRTRDEIEQLMAPSFPGATFEVRHDLLRLPYTHIVCQAVAPEAGTG
jgi:SAM-dependent methyltransferase